MNEFEQALTDALSEFNILWVNVWDFDVTADSGKIVPSRVIFTYKNETEQAQSPIITFQDVSIERAVELFKGGTV